MASRAFNDFVDTTPAAAVVAEPPALEPTGGAAVEPTLAPFVAPTLPPTAVVVATPKPLVGLPIGSPPAPRRRPR